MRTMDGDIEAPATTHVDPWWLYVLLCTNGRLYIGIAKDVEARLKTHQAGRGAIYTRMNPPLRVLARQSHASRGDALRAEYALKQLPRQKKLAWIETLAAPAVTGTTSSG